MKTQAALDEIQTVLQQVIDFAGHDCFIRERRRAHGEFFGLNRPELASGADEFDRFSAYLDWFIFDRAHSATGKTPVRMFVEAHEDLPERVRQNLLNCERSIYSSFEVKEIKDGRVVVLDLHGAADDYYCVYEQSALRNLSVGEVITARLIRWDDRYYFYGLEKWPPNALELFHREGELLRGHRITPDRREQLTAAARTRPSRKAWLRRKRQWR